MSKRSNAGRSCRKLALLGPASPFFSAVDRTVLPLSFSFCQDRGHAHDGGARRRWIAVRMGGTLGSVLEQPPLLDGSASGPDRTVVDGAANGSSDVGFSDASRGA